MASLLYSPKHLNKNNNSHYVIIKIEEGILASTFYKAIITQIPNQIKTQQKENYKPISLTKTDAKILNKIPVN
jgi:hypothetical protein